MAARASAAAVVHLAVCLTAVAALVLSPAQLDMLSPSDMGRGDTVLVGQLDFLNLLLNPCQVARVGDPLSLVRSLPTGQRRHQDQQRAEELLIELQRGSTLARELRQYAGVPDCVGLYLQGQPVMPPLAGFSRRQTLLELFRVSLYETAHLHLMVEEIFNSHHTCGNASRHLVYQMQALASNLQNILCVIKETLPPRVLQPVEAAVSAVTLHRYHDCPRRLMRNCLVLDNTTQMLSLVMEYLHEAELAESGLLQLRVARASPLAATSHSAMRRALRPASLTHR